MAKGWSHKAGRKNGSRVKVYERDNGSLYVEWWKAGTRHRKALRSIVGVPVTEKDLAVAIADQMASNLARENLQRGLAAVPEFGSSPERTLVQLLNQYHSSAPAGKWSATHRKDQARNRDYWLEGLGHGEPLCQITPARVETMGANRKQLSYIKTAFKYGFEKLRWITADQTLAGVEVRQTKVREGATYTVEEGVRVMQALEAADARLAWIAWVCTISGARYQQTVEVRKEDVTLDDGHCLIRVVNKKRKQQGEASVTQRVLVGEAERLTRLLLETPGAYMTGAEPLDYHEGMRAFDKAEKAAGIKHEKYRRWHAFKKLYGTVGEGSRGLAAQANTTRATLERNYTKPEFDAKLEAAVTVHKRLNRHNTDPIKASPVDAETVSS